MRAREIIVIVGLGDSGKTYNILKMIDAYKHGKILICDKQREPKYDVYPQIPVSLIKKQSEGIYKVYMDQWQEVVIQVNKNFRDGLVIFEDASSYLPKLEYQPMMDILVSKRHYHIDVILTFHSLNRVPPYVLDNLNKLILFKTNDNMKTNIADKIPRPEIVKHYFNIIEQSPDLHFFKIMDLKSATLTNS